MATNPGSTPTLHPDDSGRGETKPDDLKMYSLIVVAITALMLIGVGVPSSIYLNNWLWGMTLGAFCAAWAGTSLGALAAKAWISHDRT